MNNYKFKARKQKKRESGKTAITEEREAEIIMWFNVCSGGLLLYSNVFVRKKETLSPRLIREDGIKWKRIKRIILKYSSFSLFESFNGENEKFILLFGSLSGRK